MVMAIGSLDCKVAKLLTKRRNIDCTGEDYTSFDQIAQDFTRAGRLQLTPVISPAPLRSFPNVVRYQWLQPGVCSGAGREARCGGARGGQDPRR